MRRNAVSVTTSADIVKHIDGLTEANFNLLCRLIETLAANERVQRKFRQAMIHKITKLEAAISILLVGQEAQTLSQPPFYSGEMLEERTRAAEKFIEHQSEQEGLKMLRFIYEKEPPRESRRDRRRRWWGWEI